LTKSDLCETEDLGVIV